MTASHEHPECAQVLAVAVCVELDIRPLPLELSLRYRIGMAGGASDVPSRAPKRTPDGIIINNLNLSPRAYRFLRRAGCYTIDDIVSKWPDPIYHFSGVGGVLMQEGYERVRPHVPNLRPMSGFPSLSRAMVLVRYSKDRQTFLKNAQAAWETRIKQASDRTMDFRKETSRSSECG